MSESPPPPPGRNPSAAQASASSATTSQIRGSTMLLSGRVLTMLINLGVQVVIVRYLSKADYGAFAYALSFTTTARIFVTLGHNRTITRFLAIYEERRDYDRLFGTLLMEVGIITATGAALFAGGYMFQEQLAASLVDDPLAITALLIMLLLAPIDALDDLTEGMFAVFAKPRSIFFRRYIVHPALRLTVIGALVATGSGVIFLASGYVLASLLGVLYYTWTLAGALRARGILEHFHLRTASMPFREVFSFSLPLLSTELVVISMGTVSAMVLGYHSGTVAVAAYRAIRPAAVLNQFVMRSFNTLFLPLVSRLYARDDKEGIRDAYWQTAVWLTVFTFPIFALTVIFADELTVALFGQRYADSAPYLALLAAGYYFNVCLGFNALILQVFRRLRYLVVANMAAAGANVALSLSLIPEYGALGAAGANCLTLILQNILNQVGLGRNIGVGVFAWHHVRVYLSVAGIALLLWAVKQPLPSNIVVACLITALATAAIIALNRGSLRVGETFPEVAKIPLLGRILT